jgi:hypothetical protein
MKTWAISICVALTAVGLSAPPLRAAAIPIANGDFEDGNGAPFTGDWNTPWDDPPLGWTFIQDIGSPTPFSGLIADMTHWCARATNMGDGVQRDILGQTLSATVQPGLIYTLTADAKVAYVDGTGTLSGTVEIQLWDGDSMLGSDSATILEFTTTQLQVDYTAQAGDSGNLQVRYLGQLPSWSAVNYDNFVLEAIPEPMTLTLVGIGALGLLRRRRKR